jgi:predicted Holliday junction resolvase-like endonuclease
LHNFPYAAADCRFIGKPCIDYIVFKGMSEEKISEVIFVEVKTGSTKRLTQNEEQLKEVIDKKNVKWYQHNI